MRVGIVGATGYTGCELMRLLHHHPAATLSIITARSHVGVHPSFLFPNLFSSEFPLVYSDFSVKDLARNCDIVFFATPHTVAMQLAPELLAAGVRVIDLSADFRLPDIATWEKWYATQHQSPVWAAKALYGLIEYVTPQAVKEAQLIAVPGCYPTASLLAVTPFVQSGMIEAGSIVIDAKSGVSGAGRKEQAKFLYSEISENFMPYASSGHRHSPEIQHWLKVHGNNDKVDITFVPHLLPMVRGMEITAYAPIKNPDFDCQAILTNAYSASECVKILPAGDHPQTKAVRGTSFCQVAAIKSVSGKQLIMMSTIDNLLQGASGQAVRLMNIVMGLPDGTGLEPLAIWP